MSEQTVFSGLRPRIYAFLRDVEEEASTARASFPGNHVQTMALTEEVGELAKALIEVRAGKAEQREVWREAVQVAAMALRVATEGDGSIPEYDPEAGALNGGGL